jgi:uncharacterized protein YukE
MNQLPVRTELNNLIAHMKETIKSTLTSPSTFTSSLNESISVSAAQNRLNIAASEFNNALNNLVSTLNSSSTMEIEKVQEQTAELQRAYQVLIKSAQLYAAKDQEQSSSLLTSLNEVSTISLKLVNSSTVDLEKNNMLKNYSKSLAVSMTKILDVCTKSHPGQNECSMALTLLNGLSDKLENVNRGLEKETTYFAEIQSIESSSTAIQQLLQKIEADNTSSKFTQSTGSTCLELSKLVPVVVDNAVSCLFLIESNDTDSVPATQAIFNTSEMEDHAQEIYDICDKVLIVSGTQADKNTKLKQMFGFLQSLAPHTAFLCNLAKSASQNANISFNSQQQFVVLAKNIANNVSALVNKIKTASNDPSGLSIDKGMSKNVKLAVQSFIDFSKGSEFEGKQAFVSPSTTNIQRPIIENMRVFISSSIELVNICKYMLGERAPDSSAYQHMLFAHCKTVSEGLSNAIELIKSNSPGQKEASAVIEKISRSAAELDGSIIQANVNALMTLNVSPYPTLKEQALDSLKSVHSLVDIIASNSKTDVKSFVISIQQLGTGFTPMISHAIAAGKNVVIN